MVRHPHTFQYIAQNGAKSGGEYLPGTEPAPVEFQGRFVPEQKLKQNADGSMTQVEGKIHCKDFGTTPQKGDTIKFGNRSLTIFSPDPRQAAWTLWVR